MTDHLDRSDATLPQIPFIDLRGKSQLDLFHQHSETAHALVFNATNTFGVVSRAASKMLLPITDRKSRAWLERTNNPYLAEIDSIAKAMGRPGAYTFNLSYEWGCTSGAYATADGVTLLRLLDWPYPGIGGHIAVIHQSGNAGDFYNVGWPGLVGMLNGMAPGRFAATLNQAPMRKHNLTIAGDWIKNRFLVDSANGLPPPHLLRMVFETAPDYARARELLIKSPVALPVIYILSGVLPGEGCVIERTETEAVVSDLAGNGCVTAANHFASSLNARGLGWRPRTEDSSERLAQSNTIRNDVLTEDSFVWASAPMLNSFTKLGVIADASTNRLVVQGFEGNEPLTQLFSLPR